MTAGVPLSPMPQTYDKFGGAMPSSAVYQSSLALHNLLFALPVARGYVFSCSQIQMQ